MPQKFLLKSEPCRVLSSRPSPMSIYWLAVSVFPFFPLWVSCAIYKSQLCVLRISNVRFLNRRCAFFSESQMSDLNRKPTKLVTPGPYSNINLAGKSFLFSTMADGSCKKALISHFESRISEALNANQTEESMAHFG